MIDVRDLSIGNWVFDGEHTKFPMQITSLSEGYVTLSFPSNEGMDWESTPDELEGIPITEELLTKMGAKKVTDIGWNVVESYSAGVRTELRVIFFSESEIDVKIRRETPHLEDMIQSSSIHYLHELQNLFWNITRQQLKVKL